MDLAVWAYGWVLVALVSLLESLTLACALRYHRLGVPYSLRYAIGDIACAVAVPIVLAFLHLGLHKPFNAFVAMSGATFMALRLLARFSSAARWRDDKRRQSAPIRPRRCA